MKNDGQRGLRLFDAKIIMAIGSLLVAIPVLSGVIEVIATGHLLTESDDWFFYWTRFGVFAGFGTLPIGVILIVFGLVKLAKARKS